MIKKKSVRYCENYREMRHRDMKGAKAAGENGRQQTCLAQGGHKPSHLFKKKKKAVSANCSKTRSACPSHTTQLGLTAWPSDAELPSRGRSPTLPSTPAPFWVGRHRHLTGLGENPRGARDAARKQLLGRDCRVITALLSAYIGLEKCLSVLAEMLTTVYLQGIDMLWSSALVFNFIEFLQWWVWFL